MATLVTFHAHPDDEASQTAGLMAKAAASGHRVVLITATDGAQGEVHIELDDGETLAERRRAEVEASARLLGADLVWLGYPDSGMEGDEANDHPDCFSQLDVEILADRVADILNEVDADVFTFYDDHGGYGHPDHVQVHRVGMRAAELAGVEHTFENTMNRDRIIESLENAEDLGDMDRPDPAEFESFGTPDADIAYVVDARSYAGTKRAALRAHASQIPADSIFMAMPDAAFEVAFGFEYYNRPGVSDTGGPELVDLLPGLDD